MNTEEKARAYDDALKQAKKELNTCGSLDCDGARQIFRFFPQLRESEDERVIEEIKFAIMQMSYGREDTKQRCLAWLEKQKDHFRDDTKKVEQKPAQTDDEKEYIRTIKSIISDFIRDKKPEDVAYYQRIYDWLDGRHIEQKPAEWSEEDEKNLELVIDCVYEFYPDPVMKYKLKDWLSQRLKSLRPVGKESLQPHWKPSNAQINYLGAAVIEAQRRHNESVNGFPRYHALKELYEQLLKL